MTGPTSTQIPIAEGLFTWPADEPRLIGSKCSSCAEVAFPAQEGCPACSANGSETIELSRRGRLWTWTVQNFVPPLPYVGDPAEFTPYGVGYIELPEGVRVEARLTENDPDRLAIGMEMELVIERFKDDDEGRELMTFAFSPVEEG